MPELPEIETLVRGLGPDLCGRAVARVTVRENRLRGGVASDFVARLSGRRIRDLHRRGKYLLAPLDDGRVWLVHLGMTGRLTLAGPDRARERHDHVEPEAVGAETGAGLDPLGEAFTPAALFALTRERRTSIKALLMDQRRVAGLGNIYVNEILFRAGIRPRRRAARLRLVDCARLVRAARGVLAAAIRAGGSSISDYRDGRGQPGWFQLHHQVYDRAGSPCRRCATPIRAQVIVGRSSFYCPRCQT